jgi:hypothetical protein
VKGAACGGAEPICLGGACVACVRAADCPAATNDCVDVVCTSSNACAYAPKLTGAACGLGATGRCDGAGQCNQCTPGTAICAGNIPFVCGPGGQYAQQPACTGSKPICDPLTGTCGECNVVNDCPPLTTDCLVPTCVNHACGVLARAAGSTCIKGGTCDGAGTCVYGTGTDAGTGACTGPADTQVLASLGGTVTTTAYNCATSTFGQQPATTTCVQNNTGLSTGCSACFGDAIACLVKSCLSACISGPTSPTCVSCRQQSCDAAFVACSGVAPF